MIRFELEGEEAVLFNDVGSEDGWVISFDKKNYIFKVWDNGERHALGERCDKVCTNLEEVLSLVNSYT